MKNLTAKILLVSTLIITGCVSPRGKERINELRARMDEIQSHVSYFHDDRRQEMEEMRDEVVDILIQEGLQQEELIGVPGHEDAKTKALRFYAEALELAQRKLSFTDAELKQKWPLMSWAWDEGLELDIENGTDATIRQEWNAHKALNPFVWAYTAGEQIVCFLGDICGIGWVTEHQAIEISPMGPETIETIKRHYERVQETSLLDRESLVQRFQNVRAIMTYTLVGDEREIKAHKMALDNSDRRIVGERLSTTYQEIWNEKVSEVLSISTSETYERGSVIPKSYLRPAKVTYKTVTNTQLEVTVLAIGFIPFDQLAKAVVDIAIDDRNEEEDKLRFYLDPLEPKKAE